MGWGVVVVDIQLSISHREPILHSQWGGASWSWIYNYLYHREPILHSQWGGTSCRGYTTIYTH